MNYHQDEIFKLVEQWASHFGYYDGRIDLKSGGDLTEFCTKQCTLTAHAPLWRTKPGKENPIPATTVRKTLAKILRWVKFSRHNMHILRHPKKDKLCLFFIVKARFVMLPFNIMTVPLILEVNAIKTDVGLRIDEIHEWPAKTTDVAQQLLVNEHDWPQPVNFETIKAFGAIS